MKSGDLVKIIFGPGPEEVGIFIGLFGPERSWVFWEGEITSFPTFQLGAVS